MCVTANPAEISGTRTYAYDTTGLEETGETPRHVCGYQNVAKNFGGPNVMFLNFAGSDLKLVHGGPERTKSLMDDMTYFLPELRPTRRSRGDGLMGGSERGVTVEEYGDYSVVIAQGPSNMFGAFDRVRPNRRPNMTTRLVDTVSFYMSWAPTHSFVLACFDGNVKPEHPITVSYVPNDPDVLTIPGLDGHDGRVPTPGAPVHRGFDIAFGIHGAKLPFPVRYGDSVDPAWAPGSVTGFKDNRPDGPNGDYVLPLAAVRSGLMGRELADQLV